MPSAARAAEKAAKSFPYRPGAYYGTAGGRTLGAGLIYDSVQYPLLDEDTSFFDTVAGLVYVLTHECDVDPANERLFNESVIICPIIKFEEWVSEFALFSSETAVLQAITDLAGDRIFRATYLPPLPDGSLPFGGILYLNQLCSTHRMFFAASNARAVCATSEYAQRIIDYKLQNHLFRPKADPLPRLE